MPVEIELDTVQAQHLQVQIGADLKGGVQYRGGDVFPESRNGGMHIVQCTNDSCLVI